ncbi:MAG: stalk domain-containing protein [Anaerotignum sp.]|nr:stalk domain-containing protein [Anaerotignum sp.]
MRKKVAALLCAVMCIGAFTGCSSTELGYLQMSADMFNKMEVCEASGTVNVDLDVDAMKEYVADVSKAAGYTDEMTQASLQELEGFKGKESVAVDYSLKMDMDTLTYYLDMNVTYKGKKYDMGDMYYSMTDGVFVSGNTIWGTYELTKDMMGTDEKSYLSDGNFAKELKTALDQSKYICLISMDELGLTEEEMKEIVPEGGFGNLYTSAIEFYKNAFSGFTTNMVSQVSGGYKIQAGGQEVAKLFVNLLDYIGNNPDTVLAATTTYMMDVMKTMNSSEEEMAAFKAEMDAAKADTASIKAATDEMKTMLQQSIAEPSVSKVLDSFAYEATVTKSGAGLNTKEAYSITNGSKSVLKVTSNGTVKAGSGKVVVPATSTSTADFEAKMSALTEKYNPVTAVTALWGWEGDSEAMLTKERAEESFLSQDGDIDFAEYVVADGRVYLPLRVICEAMGETVEWNNAEKVAYIVHADGKTAMKGIIQDGTSFVSVRDFEKLGYTVEYQTVDDLKQVTVTK